MISSSLEASYDGAPNAAVCKRPARIHVGDEAMGKQLGRGRPVVGVGGETSLVEKVGRDGRQRDVVWDRWRFAAVCKLVRHSSAQKQEENSLPCPPGTWLRVPPYRPRAVAPPTSRAPHSRDSRCPPWPSIPGHRSNVPPREPSRRRIPSGWSRRSSRMRRLRGSCQFHTLPNIWRGGERTGAFADAKVGDLADSIRVHQDIVRLEILESTGSASSACTVTKTVDDQHSLDARYAGNAGKTDHPRSAE